MVMAQKFKIKKGDQVMIIAGDDKGKTGEVLKVLTKKDAVIVAGCKIAKKLSNQLSKTKRVDLQT
jgi:large subunit ribosomal protein L24